MSKLLKIACIFLTIPGLGAFVYLVIHINLKIHFAIDISSELAFGILWIYFSIGLSLISLILWVWHLSKQKFNRKLIHLMPVLIVALNFLALFFCVIYGSKTSDVGVFQITNHTSKPLRNVKIIQDGAMIGEIKRIDKNHSVTFLGKWVPFNRSYPFDENGKIEATTKQGIKVYRISTPFDKQTFRIVLN